MSVFGRLNLRFVVIVLIYGGAVFLVYRDEVLDPVLAPLTRETAHIVFFLLHSSGFEAVREGTVITLPAVFSYEIAYECTGFLPVMTFVVCVLAYPARWRARGLGLMIGVPLLWALNLLRLVSLFYIGVHFPGAFAWFHEVAWEGLLALAFIGLWMGWMCWAGRTVSPSAHLP